ncbi:putative zinc-containing alcohol dehydrogenase [Sphaerosporella brunnea]|uniref:Putative zinc-containing alcohol dehydrogenase n=1 Tax=Sphaerosporella brunnea TaxID=1250544 RepID=A0A5J5ENL0_9PEZI|nr:putative zinc-containing alcohol dehydrogenase [Sphaerosporella brunnea]
MSAPAEAKAWVVTNNKDGVNALKQETRPVPKPDSREVLVKMKAVSLNYRDLIIPQGLYPFAVNLPVVAASDGAGEVIAVGDKVTTVKVGDKVSSLFHQKNLAGPLNPVSIKTGLGGDIDGCLREYAVFEEHGVVKAPSHLNFEEAATLPCAALTAWNGLYGNIRPFKAGDSVLVQGTGGVSVFALQFAKAAGTFVIAITSTDEKARRLTEMGADVVINYKKHANWGEIAKQKSPGGLGVDVVVEIAGESTLPQSYAAVKIEGTIASIGFVGGPGKSISSLEPLSHVCTLRGIYVGSRAQMEDMNASIEVNKIHPVIDRHVFDFEHVKEAYEYQLAKKHFGKVVIRI